MAPGYTREQLAHLASTQNFVESSFRRRPLLGTVKESKEMRLLIVGIATRFPAILFLLALLGSVYLFLIRPTQLHWGATTEELALPMPEDNIVTRPVFDATRAITIHATAESIWPWLVQMGYKRAGFYGYDLIESIGNGSGVRSATKILPEYQDPKIGDPVPLSFAATLVFGSINPNSWIVWRSRERPTYGVFIWELVPVDANTTRLISRIRWNYAPGWWSKVLGIFTEFADHVAVRRILEGVRDRAEGRPSPSLILEALEIAGWLVALFEFCLTIGFVAAWRRWQIAWIMALGAGVLLQFILYSDVPVWIRAVLPWLYLALIIPYWISERRRRMQGAVLASETTFS
jgi:hypothetical protein